jgi:hypothetical protein
MLTTYDSYRLLAANLPKSRAHVAAEPQNARDTAYYQKTIGSIKSVDDFLKNTRVFNYAMTAFGLGDMAYAKGFMRKVLTEGVSNARSFANQLSDPRFRRFAAAFDFKSYGAAATSRPQATDAVVARFAQQQLETEAGDQNQGVRLALYFQRVAPTLTSTYGILADKALLQVVQTALGIPAAASRLPIEKQAQDLSERLSLGDFKDPAKLNAFIQKFAVQYDIANETATATSSPLSLLQSQGQAQLGLGVDLMTSLQGLRLGR